MARTEFVLVKDVWTNMGDGPLIVTVDMQGKGSLFVNTEQADATAHIFTPKDNAGDQIAEQTTGITVFVKATGVGWAVISDTD